MLIIVNPYATTVSDRLKNLVVYALQGRFEVETVTTEAQNHATEIGREVRDHGYDIVVAFGGDGTLNEVVNGLAGTDVPVSVLPGGSTNVVCRTLGIPNDVVDATEHLLALADDWAPRKIDLGMVDDRTSSSPAGSESTRPWSSGSTPTPKMKSRAGPYYYTWAALSAFYRGFLFNPVHIEVEVAGQTIEGVTALAQNSDPFTYFASRPIRVCEEVEIDDGTLSLGVLKRAAQRDMPTLIPRLFSEKRPGARHRQIVHFEDVTEAVVRSTSTLKDGRVRPFPVQVDGDYIGERARGSLAVDPAPSPSWPSGVPDHRLPAARRPWSPRRPRRQSPLADSAPRRGSSPRSRSRRPSRPRCGASPSPPRSGAHRQGWSHAGRLSLTNMTPCPMKTSSSIVTPSQMKVWLWILQAAPIAAPRWISTKVPIWSGPRSGIRRGW